MRRLSTLGVEDCSESLPSRSRNWRACLIGVVAGLLSGIGLPFLAANSWAMSYDVFLLAGQSNMDGRGLTNDLTGGWAFWMPPQTNVLVYYQNNNLTNGYTASWQPVRTGWTETNGALDPTQFGPELSIGYVLATANPARRIAFIKVTRGGTSIANDWGPGKNMYNLLTNTVPIALQALTNGGNTCTIRGLLWHQGEGDYGETQSFYLSLLTNFIISVRSSLSLPNLPFVIGEINRSNPNPNYQIIRQAQYAASQLVSNTYFLTSFNLPADTSDNHFFSTAVIGLGQRFGSQANAFLSPMTVTQTWDLAGSAAWSTNSARWTTDGGVSHHAWSSSNDTALFIPTGGNATVTVSNGITAYSLVIASNATGNTFAGDALTIGNNGLSINESAGIAGSVNIGGLQSWSIAGGKTLVDSGSLSLSIHTLNVAGDGVTVLGGVVYDVSNDPTNSAFLYDSTLILKTGNGTLTLLNSNLFAGGVMIFNGVVQMGDGVSSNGVVPGNIDDNATLVFANPSAQVYGGLITGTGTVVKSSAALLSLIGSNSYSGGTTINGGTVSISADNALGAGGVVSMSNGAMLQVTGTNDVDFGRAVILGAGGGGFDVNSPSNTFTLSSPISGCGGLVKSGAGSLTIANTLSFTGQTTIAQGILNLGTSPLNEAVSVSSGATLAMHPLSGLMGQYYNISPSNVSNSDPDFVSITSLNTALAGQTPALWSLSATAGTNFDFHFDGSAFPNPSTYNASGFEVMWTGIFLAPSSGIYTFDTASDDGSMLWIDGNPIVSNNAFHGLTTVTGATNLSAGAHSIVIGYYQGGNVYGFYADVTLPGGSMQRLPSSLLQYGATAFTIGSLSGASGSIVNLGSYPLTINQTTDGTFAGSLIGGGSLTKNGMAELILGGSNSFTGTTTINGGTLTLDYRTQNNNKISPDVALLLNGGTLKFLGNLSGAYTQSVSGLILLANTGASTIINQSGNLLLDFTPGNLSVGYGDSIIFRLNGGAGLRLPGVTNSLLGVWAVTDTGDPAFLDGNNFVQSLASYDGTLPAAGANPAGNYLDSVGVVTNSETANLLNLRDAPSLLLSNGVVLHLNSGLQYPGLTPLSISGAGQLGASNAGLVINANNALGTNALLIGARISSGGGSLSKLGAGTVILINDSTYSGGTTISAGTLQIGNGGASGNLGTGSITNNGTLVYNHSNAVAITNSISGSGVLVQLGTNTLSINTPQGYSGGTIVSNGTLLVMAPDQNHAFVPNSSVIVNSSASVLVTNVNNIWNDVSWALNGGVVKVVGGGHQHLGPLTMNGGTITTGPGSYAYDGRGNYSLDANVTVGGNTPAVLDANTGINLGALIAGNVAVTFTVADVTGDAGPDLIVTTKLTDRDGGGTRGLVKVGPGAMLLSAACDFTGSAVVSNGVLMLGHALAVQNSTVNNLVDGGLAFAGTNVFVLGGLAGNGSFALTNSSGMAVTIYIGNNGSNTVYNGALGGTGGLVKTGNGTLGLSGANTFGGATTVSNGTLAISGSGMMANSATITIANGATLDVSGHSGSKLTLFNGQTVRGAGTVNGDLIVADGATLAPGDSLGTLTCANSLIFSNNATVQYDLGASSDLTVVGSNLVLGGILNLSDAGGFTTNTYTLFTYGGTLTYNGLAIGNRPNWTFGYTIDTNTPGRVKLIVTNAASTDPFVEWQLQYFHCTNCPEALPSADADGTGQNNQFKYVAGLDPTNSSSVFLLQIANVAGQPAQKNLIYSPVVTGRTYTVQFSTNLPTVSWTSLGGYAGPTTNGTQVTVTDSNATQAAKFYRLYISMP